MFYLFSKESKWILAYYVKLVPILIILKIEHITFVGSPRLAQLKGVKYKPGPKTIIKLKLKELNTLSRIFLTWCSCNYEGSEQFFSFCGFQNVFSTTENNLSKRISGLTVPHYINEPSFFRFSTPCHFRTLLQEWKEVFTLSTNNTSVGTYRDVSSCENMNEAFFYNSAASSHHRVYYNYIVKLFFGLKYLYGGSRGGGSAK